MFRIIWRIFFVILCGYLFIEWFPITYPIHVSEIFVGPIIYPLEFFAASMALFFGLIVFVKLFQEIFNRIGKRLKKKRSKL